MRKDEEEEVDLEVEEEVEDLVSSIVCVSSSRLTVFHR